MGLALTAASVSTLRPLARSWGLRIGFTDYGSAGSEDVNNNNNNNNELRRPSQPVHRRRSELGSPVFNASGTSQDTLNPFHTRDKSVSSQATANYTTPKFDRVQWSANTNADPEHAGGSIELSSVDGTMDHSTSRYSDKKSGVRQTEAELS